MLNNFIQHVNYSEETNIQKIKNNNIQKFTNPLTKNNNPNTKSYTQKQAKKRNKYHTYISNSGQRIVEFGPNFLNLITNESQVSILKLTVSTEHLLKTVEPNETENIRNKIINTIIYYKNQLKHNNIKSKLITSRV